MGVVELDERDDEVDEASVRSVGEAERFRRRFSAKTDVAACRDVAAAVRGTTKDWLLARHHRENHGTDGPKLVG